MAARAGAYSTSSAVDGMEELTASLTADLRASMKALVCERA